MTVLFLGLAVIGLKLLPVYQTLWILPGLLIPLLQPSEVHALMSMPRFVLVLFPLFIVLGTLLQPRVAAHPGGHCLSPAVGRPDDPICSLVLGIVTIR